MRNEREPQSASDVAWAAGLFEGEGTFVAARRRDRFYLRLVISMSDEDVLERFRQAVGGRHAPTPVKRRHSRHLGAKQMWRLEYSGIDAIRIGELFRPWLGARRTARLDEIHALVAGNPPTKYGTGWARRRELYGETGRRAAAVGQ